MENIIETHSGEEFVHPLYKPPRQFVVTDMCGVRELRTCISTVIVAGKIKIYWDKGEPSVGTEKELGESVRLAYSGNMWVNEAIHMIESMVVDCQEGSYGMIKFGNGMEISFRVVKKYGPCSSPGVQSTLCGNVIAEDVVIIADEKQVVVKGGIGVCLQ